MSRFLRAILITVLLGSLPVASLAATTYVDVQTALGDFRIELYEEATPAAVDQFLDNVESGAYHFTMVHHALGGVLRGGLYQFNSCSLIPTAPDFSFPAGESGLANTTFSVALQRDPTDPSRLTNEYRINLASNTVDPTDSADPEVIGEIIQGRPLLSAIHGDLTRFYFAPQLPSVPTFGYPLEYLTCSVLEPAHLIRVAMSVNNQANTFDTDSNSLNLSVDAGEAGLLSLSLTLQPDDSAVIVQAQPETVTVLSEAMEGMATFNTATGELTVPQIAVDGDVVLLNAVFDLTDVNNILFTLRSWEEPEA